MLGPPLAQVLAKGETFLRVGELAFVNEETGLHLAGENLVLDLVEGNHHGLKFSVRQAEIELEGEIGARQ